MTVICIDEYLKHIPHSYLRVLEKLMKSEARRPLLDRVVGMYESRGGEVATLGLDLDAENCAALPAWLLHACLWGLGCLRAAFNGR